MIQEYALNHPELILKPDIAAEHPIYIYLPKDKQKLFYSRSAKKLFEHSDVKKPFTVNRDALSFLLQSGVVPPPQTIFDDIFVLSVGHSAIVRTENDKITLQFLYEFPFLNKYRQSSLLPEESKILQLLADATIAQLNPKQDSYLFHSAGKDSNSIALALSEAGYQDRITLISHKSKGDYNESDISEKIAKKLGFSHQKLFEPESLSEIHKQHIYDFFEQTPLPCLDNIVLTYPLYASQINFKGANIIDGSGNDVYIGHIPSAFEFKRQQQLARFHYLRPITGQLRSCHKLGTMSATRAEWTGLFGLTQTDTERLMGTSCYNVYHHWRAVDKKYKELDYFDFRAMVRGGIIDTEIFINKTRMASYVFDYNLILPFANPDVAAYFSRLNETSLFDRKQFKNKLILREMLKQRIGLDSDTLGKMAFEFDYYALLMKMQNDVIEEILSCTLWQRSGAQAVLNHLYKKIALGGGVGEKAKALFQRIYLISSWYNRNKYVYRAQII